MACLCDCHHANCGKARSWLHFSPCTSVGPGTFRVQDDRNSLRLPNRSSRPRQRSSREVERQSVAHRTAPFLRPLLGTSSLCLLQSVHTLLGHSSNRGCAQFWGHAGRYKLETLTLVSLSCRPTISQRLVERTK